jgi:hypothetical protein
LLSRFGADYDSYEESGDIIKFLQQEWNINRSTVVKLYLAKAGRAWYGTDSHNRKTEILIRIIMIPIAILFAMAMIVLFKKRNQWSSLFWFSLLSFLVIGNVWGINTFMSSLSRYMVPVLIAACIPVSWLLFQWIGAIRGKSYFANS